MNQNINQSNNINNQLKKTSKDLFPDAGYGSTGSRYQNINNFQNSMNNNNIQSSNFQSQNMHYPNESQSKDNARPLWSYREIKYDENRQPMNSEEIKTQKIQRKSNLEQLQQEDQKYFNNNKYQKVKVTKKVKNIENIQPKIQKKGPMDDYEQQYNIQNNNYEQLNPQNIENNVNQDNLKNNINEMNQINNFNENEEQNEENIENMNNEEDEEEGEIELDQKDIQDEYDKIIDDNGQNINNQQFNYNEEGQKKDLNNLQNQIQNNEINDEELQKENYDLDIENLADVHSDNEKEENNNLQAQQQNLNQNNQIESNNQNRPMPSFNETITQKVTDAIEDVKIFPEGNIESWNCVADYTP